MTEKSSRWWLPSYWFSSLWRVRDSTIASIHIERWHGGLSIVFSTLQKSAHTWGEYWLLQSCFCNQDSSYELLSTLKTLNREICSSYSSKPANYSNKSTLRHNRARQMKLAIDRTVNRSKLNVRPYRTRRSMTREMRPSHIGFANCSPTLVWISRLMVKNQLHFEVHKNRSYWLLYS